MSVEAFLDGRVTLHTGDALERLRGMRDGCVQTCVTSPPYFGLRDYGTGDAQIGLEPTPDEFVAALVAVFREVRRVLKDDGTLWLNLGDSYSNAGTRQGDRDGNASGGVNSHRKVGSGYVARAPGLKNKDLIGIPWRVAFALQADGWFLRQDIIWHKPNPMPESVRDRCTKAHEYIFLLSKSPKYFFDNEAIRENSAYPKDGVRVATPKNAALGLKPTREYGHQTDGKRNKRSVWTVTTKPFKGAHFATFPPDLIEPCILAGSAPGDVVLDPFGGAGTTAVSAVVFGRRCVLIELNPEYASMIKSRVNGLYQGMDERNRESIKARQGDAPADAGPLFDAGVVS